MSAAQQLVAVPAVCSTLRSTGALDRLLDGAATTEELTAELALDREGLSRLLAAAEGLGIIHRHDGGWTTSMSRDVLERLDRDWGSLESMLKGAPRMVRSDDADQAGAIYRSVVDRLPELYGDAPDRLAAAFDRVEARILDVGAGAAPWSAAMLRAWPAATAVALDLPGVVDVTERSLADLGLAERVRVVGSDLWSTEFAAEFDLIVLAGVCHLFAADRVALLLARVVRWLRSGGRVVIVDAGGSGEPTTLDVALHDLSLWLRSGGGHRDASIHLRWLIDAGLSRARKLDIGHDGLVAVTATLEERR
jgi:SAM-dependent methyltransferase